MKKMIVLGILSAFLITLSACGILSFDTDKVQIIENQKSSEKTGLEGKLSDEDKSGDVKSDLDDKSNVLQADTEEYIRKNVGDIATDVIAAIKDNDMEKLAKYVHPDKGVRFTPYGYVDTKKDIVITADNLKEISKDSKKYLWGNYDGSGEPIELTFSEYYSEFIYDADYANAENIGYNKSLSKGNFTDNSREVYSNSIIVEYYFSGFDPQYEGIDWKSLKLVFEKKADSWCLVGIIHGQWTI